MAKHEGEAVDHATQKRDNEEQIDGPLPDLLELYKFGNKTRWALPKQNRKYTEDVPEASTAKAARGVHDRT
ncbi:hypothetical protein D8674_008877 [Pyrus ussuriensis x Pyrus communis]|uniref:Uncharacterized protein n=1 Tax=Pyrus ussuriensis x Pyrus communis TaxID=2448454 RepID=A0A5N5HUY1_9ROSA|nr:hypothetical protein D8674_008877 [Pyrus ussuriensis x Pyrus communis]